MASARDPSADDARLDALLDQLVRKARLAWAVFVVIMLAVGPRTLTLTPSGPGQGPLLVLGWVLVTLGAARGCTA